MKNEIILLIFTLLCLVRYSESQSLRNLPGPAKDTWVDEKDFILIPVEVGENKQKLSLSIDTASDLSWFPSSLCKNCNSNNLSFDSSKSNTFKTKSEKYELNDSIGAISGVISSDNLSIGPLSVDNFEFALIDSIGFEYSDYKSGDLSLKYKTSKKGILSALKENKQIQKKTFTLGGGKNSGQIFLGQFPQDYKENESKISSCQVNDNKVPSTLKNFWTCSLSSGQIGDNMFDINSWFYINTASGVITAPDLFQDFFSEFYTKNCKSLKSGKYETFFECEKVDFSKVESLYLTFNGWSYEIPSKSLFKKNKDDDKYSFLIRFNQRQEHWVFGLNFLQEFTTIFDEDNNKLSFYGGNRIKFDAGTQEVKPTSDKKNEKSKEKSKEKEETKINEEENKKNNDSSSEKKTDSNEDSNNETISIEEENKKKMKLILVVGGGVMIVAVIFLIFLCLCRSCSKKDEENKPFLKDETH